MQHAMATDIADLWPGWRALLPSLVLAYPVTVLLFQGERICEPVCFEATLESVVTVGLGYLAILLVGAGVASVLPQTDGERWRNTWWLAAPTPGVGHVLLGIFGVFVLLMALDAMTIYEGLWKPVALPLSFLLFFPVWALYVATFPLAVLVSAVGFTGSPALSLVVRGLVVAIGFPLSVLFQYHLVAAVAGTGSRTS